MRLLHLSISERRGEPARQLDFGREKGGVGFVAITGPEGSGKTSTLEAIALHKEHLAPYNAQPSVTDRQRSPPHPKILHRFPSSHRARPSLVPRLSRRREAPLAAQRLDDVFPSPFQRFRRVASRRHRVQRVRARARAVSSHRALTGDQRIARAG